MLTCVKPNNESYHGLSALAGTSDIGILTFSSECSLNKTSDYEIIQF